jgi:N-acyl-D-aspartate/D-glutamate deacylase
MQQGMPWSWVTFPEFLDAVDRAPKAVNILPYVPVSPLLIWVMGFEAAKAGKLPTPEQHAELRGCCTRRWMPAPAAGRPSACCRPGPAAVQRDHDGSPMPTDVMHDDTCREFAKVLAERNDGFMQMLLVSGDNARDRAFYEEMATLSGRPIIMNVVQAFDDRRTSIAACWTG